MPGIIQARSIAPWVGGQDTPLIQAAGYDALLTLARTGGVDGWRYLDATTWQRYRRMTPVNAGGLPLLVPEAVGGLLTGACVTEAGQSLYFDLSDDEDISGELTARGLVLATDLGTGTAISKLAGLPLQMRSGTSAWKGARITFPHTAGVDRWLFMARVKLLASTSDLLHPWYFGCGGSRLRIGIDSALAGQRVVWTDNNNTLIDDETGPDLGLGVFKWVFVWASNDPADRCRLWCSTTPLGGGDSASATFTRLTTSPTAPAYTSIQLWAYNPGGAAPQDIDIEEAYWLAA